MKPRSHRPGHGSLTHSPLTRGPAGVPGHGVPGKRTLTMGLAPGASAGPAPLQRQAQGQSATPRSVETGAGQRLPADVQARMEHAFGADFSAVRIHEGAQAASLGALAYTQGTDIHFAPGQYQPSTPRGQELLGHELTHVVQQSQGRVQATTQAKGMDVNTDASLEHEADEMGARAARGELVNPAGPGGHATHATTAAVQLSSKNAYFSLDDDEEEEEEALVPPITKDEIYELAEDQCDATRIQLNGWMGDNEDDYRAEDMGYELLQALDKREDAFRILHRIENGAVQSELLQEQMLSFWEDQPFGGEVVDALHHLNLDPDAGEPNLEDARSLYDDHARQFEGADISENCEHRAHAICKAINTAVWEIGQNYLYKEWIFPQVGKLDCIQPWVHHVTAVIVTDEGPYALDPVLQMGPVKLAVWRQRVGRHDDQVTTTKAGWEILGTPGGDGKQNGSTL